MRAIYAHDSRTDSEAGYRLGHAQKGSPQHVEAVNRFHGDFYDGVSQGYLFEEGGHLFTMGRGEGFAVAKEGVVKGRREDDGSHI